VTPQEKKLRHANAIMTKTINRQTPTLPALVAVAGTPQ